METLNYVASNTEYMANIIATSSREELAMYYYQTLYSPPKSTLLKANKNQQL